MKIAIIVRSLAMAGGGERQAAALARELGRLGHAATIYTFAVSRDANVVRILNGLRVVTLGEPYPPTIPRRLLGLLAPVGTLWYARREEAMAKRLARRIDPATDVLNPQSWISHHVAAHVKRLVRDMPSVWSMNDLHLWRVWLVAGGRRPGILRRAVAWFRDWRELTRFIAPQDAMAVFNAENRERVRRFFGKEADIVPSGLDTERFAYRRRNAPAGRPLQLLAHGFFHRQHRFEDAIRALRLLADAGYEANLTISGNYTFKDTARAYHAELTRLVHDLGLDGRVTFSGEVSDGEVVEHYQTSDVFLFPNHRPEGGYAWGLSVFEAMACGTPAVLNRAAGAAEVLTDRENVMLVNPTDPAGIASAVRELADRPELYRALSEEGARFVREHISWRRHAERMLEIFGRVSASRP